jgi:hypothetical protein
MHWLGTDAKSCVYLALPSLQKACESEEPQVSCVGEVYPTAVHVSCKDSSDGITGRSCSKLTFGLRPLFNLKLRITSDPLVRMQYAGPWGLHFELPWLAG